MRSFELNLARAVGSLATRSAGEEARAIVVDALKAGDNVVLDFAQTQPTPSFADELIGGLAAEMGRRSFLERISIVGIDDGVRALLNRVVANRLKQIETEAA